MERKVVCLGRDEWMTSLTCRMRLMCLRSNQIGGGLGLMCSLTCFVFFVEEFVIFYRISDWITMIYI